MRASVELFTDDDAGVANVQTDIITSATMFTMYRSSQNFRCQQLFVSRKMTKISTWTLFTNSKKEIIGTNSSNVKIL